MGNRRKLTGALPIDLSVRVDAAEAEMAEALATLYDQDFMESHRKVNRRHRPVRVGEFGAGLYDPAGLVIVTRKIVDGKGFLCTELTNPQMMLLDSYQGSDTIATGTEAQRISDVFNG